MITTSPRSKLSIARCAASMLVAFESLTNRTPPTTATGSSACSRPVNDSTARTIASCGTPAICATVAAAITSATRCRPMRRIDDSGTSGVVGRKEHLLRARRARQRQRLRIVGVDHRPVVWSLVRENPRLRGAVHVHRAVTIEMVGRQVQQHGNPRMKRVRRLELKAADLDDVKRLRRRCRDLRAQRRADVSADERLAARRR